MCAEMAQETG